ncbi:MAG: Ku protein, partial [Gemmatimonadota bacterium]
MTFGLVSIPVSLSPATESKDVRFHLFDREGRRVRYRRVAEERGRSEAPAGADPDTTPDERPSDERGADERAEPGDRSERDEGPAAGPPREVAHEELMRGYEVEPDRFVLLTPEEIARARPSPSRAIDLEDFVLLEQIDPVYFDKAYHVAPSAG